MSQLRSANVTEQKLTEMFKNSAYVARTEFTLDPEDKTGSMVLHLKRPVKMEVFQLHAKNKPSRVVIDITPVTVQRR